MIRSHHIALDPNAKQASLLARHCGYARVAANWARDEFRASWFTGDGKSGAWLSDMDLRKRFNAVKFDLFPWCRWLSQAAAKNAIIHMGQGLDGWGDYCKARKRGEQPRKVGFPQLRKKHRKMAYTASNGRNTVQVDGRKIRLPVMGWVRMREELREAGNCLLSTR